VGKQGKSSDEETDSDRERDVLKRRVTFLEKKLKEGRGKKSQAEVNCLGISWRRMLGKERRRRQQNIRKGGQGLVMYPSATQVSGSSAGSDTLSDGYTTSEEESSDEKGPQDSVRFLLAKRSHEAIFDWEVLGDWELLEEESSKESDGGEQKWTHIFVV
jgi:hypothetical protein